MMRGTNRVGLRPAALQTTMAVLIALVGTLGLVDAASAQQRPTQRPPRAEIERRVQERMATLLQAELDLSDAEVERLRGVMELSRARRDSLLERSRAIRREILEADATTDDERAEALIDELVRLRQSEVELFESEVTELGSVLSAPQLVRFFVFRERMEGRMRQMRDGAGPPPGLGRRPRGGLLQPRQ